MIEGLVNKPDLAMKSSQASVAGSKSSSPTFSVDEAKTAEPGAAPISPRLRYDSVSGVVITEFLDRTGAIQAQSPTNAVLAYLRAGLGSDGVAKKDSSAETTEAQAAPDAVVAGHTAKTV